ncbi:hypothetical protein TNCV_3242081 [Trichonephila clavipes]|nr:hypothetical protein TNCV_3242081 [Trichonephila clavipes]
MSFILKRPMTFLIRNVSLSHLVKREDVGYQTLPRCCADVKYSSSVTSYEAKDANQRNYGASQHLDSKRSTFIVFQSIPISGGSQSAIASEKTEILSPSQYH